MLGFGGCWRSKFFGGQCQYDIPFWKPQTKCKSAVKLKFEKSRKKSLRPQFEAEGGQIPNMFSHGFNHLSKRLVFMRKKIWNLHARQSSGPLSLTVFWGCFLQDGGCYPKNSTSLLEIRPIAFRNGAATLPCSPKSASFRHLKKSCQNFLKSGQIFKPPKLEVRNQFEPNQGLGGSTLDPLRPP